MYTTVDKTVFLYLSENTDTEPLVINENMVIRAAPNNEHVSLGVKFVTSTDIVAHIKRNMKDRMFNVSNFYEWLHINEFTPVKVKVLYTCMFTAYLYGVEAWWNIDK